MGKILLVNFPHCIRSGSVKNANCLNEPEFPELNHHQSQSHRRLIESFITANPSHFFCRETKKKHRTQPFLVWVRFIGKKIPKVNVDLIFVQQGRELSDRKA